MALKYYMAVILFILSAHNSRASEDQYKFTRVDISDGLSHNQVNCMIKDSKGFVWLGTKSGLNRYDGYNFKIFKHNPDDSLTIPDNFVDYLFEDHEGLIWVRTRQGFAIYDPVKETFTSHHRVYGINPSLPGYSITSLMHDRQGNTWMVSSNSGLYKYSPQLDSLIHIISNPLDSTSLISNSLSVIADDPEGYIWIIHHNGIIEKMYTANANVILRSYDLYRYLREKPQTFELYIDRDGDLWIYSTSDANGVFYFNTENLSLHHLNQNSSPYRLNNNIVMDVIQDEEGLIWIGTDHGGINLLNKENFTISYILHNPDDQRSLSQNSVISLYRDNNNIIWVGTFKGGVNYYHENLLKFSLFKHQPSNPNSLGFNDVNCFLEDYKGNIWIGTNGGGLDYYNRSSNTFTTFVHDPEDPHSISNDVIVSLCQDHTGRLWIGTFYGGLNYFDGERFYSYTHIAGDPESISDNRIWEIFEDSENNLWIGTLGGGLELFDRRTNTFKHYNAGEPNSVNSEFVIDIIEDKEENLWIATANGLDKMDKQTGRFTHYIRINNDTSSISNNNVIILLLDSRGQLWLGTRDGLNLYNKASDNFIVFRQSDGLPDNTISGIVEDNSGNLWLSTINGLSNLIIKEDSLTGRHTYTFKNYDESDGLQGKEFNEKSVYKTTRGELLFGGSNGFNMFYPENIKMNKIKPKVVITDFQLFNKRLETGSKINGRILLDQSISYTRELVLKHNEDMFSIEFAALSYLHPGKNRYKFMLEGFNKSWISASDDQRTATYTNLDPGEYIFHVKASNNDGVWNHDATTLKITVRPPFWLTPWAIGIYIILILGALLLLRHLIQERERLKFHTQQEKQKSQRMHELDMMKIRFFTNISHEFRTPLTLILNPLEKLIATNTVPDNKQYLMLIQRNARRLLTLVNQLLDFRRMDVQKFSLNPSMGNIIEFLKDVTFSFIDLADKKNIQLTFYSEVEEFFTLFDHDKLEKILFNLLSNAFKFTNEKGKIAVKVKFPDSVPDIHKQKIQVVDKQKLLEIRVIDTGIGISGEKHDLIFERFFQNEPTGNILNQGSGIGLSLTNEFVKIHSGSITVESESGKGSCFSVLLPLDEITSRQEAADRLAERRKPEQNIVIRDTIDYPDSPKGNKNKPALLLVEDNEDFRFYLKDNLKHKYTIQESSNGTEAWQQSIAYIPDLIISDVMMPGMDGIELCRKLKSDKRTSHIPVILLTARTSDQQKVEGFETGADDYVTKPFNFEILESRIRNLIARRDAIRKAFNRHIEIKPGEISITSIDEKLIQKALDVVEKNISNSEFSVEELSRELGMSRVHLYKKLLSLTGRSPIEFIRIMRLKRAAQLLEKSQMTVSEVAYEVGFNDPKYFSKYFKTEFKILPSQYNSRKK